jgi:hypothetical protein
VLPAEAEPLRTGLQNLLDAAIYDVGAITRGEQPLRRVLEVPVASVQHENIITPNELEEFAINLESALPQEEVAVQQRPANAEQPPLKTRMSPEILEVRSGPS